MADAVQNEIVGRAAGRSKNHLQTGTGEVVCRPAGQPPVKIDGDPPLAAGGRPPAQPQNKLGLIIGIGEIDAGQLGDQIVSVDQVMHCRKDEGRDRPAAPRP